MQNDLNLKALKVMPGRILGEILSNLETSKGGILLASTAKEIPQKARVLKVGAPKRDKKGKLLAPVAEVGNIVYFKKNFGFKWKQEHKEYVFLERDDITGVEE